MTKKSIKRLLLVAIAMLIAYVGFFEVQTYLGKEALKATGLKSIELSEALKQSARSGRYVLADMSAIWCPTCRKLDKNIFSDAAVKQTIAEHYIFSRIEYETAQGKDFVEKYNIKGFPTLLILDQNANSVLQLPLTFDPELFIDYLTDFIEMKNL